MSAKETPRKRAVRVDVRRNYQRLLTAATDVFTEEGADASMVAVARRADVGIATLYRHFPTRQDLMEALLTDRYDALSDRARELLADPSPGDALVTWLRAFITHVTAFRGMAASVMITLRDERSELFASCHLMRASGEELFTRAQLAGVVRPDVSYRDLLKLVGAIAMATEQTPEEADRLLALAMRGAMPDADRS
jgi:AcrR family transcriptional regulator